MRVPTGYVARVLIAGRTDYSLFLFDAELPDAIGRELESFTRMRHEYAPVVIIQASDNFNSIVKTVTRSLSLS